MVNNEAVMRNLGRLIQISLSGTPVNSHGNLIMKKKSGTPDNFLGQIESFYTGCTHDKLYLNCEIVLHGNVNI